eukprot:COSAG06_NODE_35100_length_464_cov_1.213699_1_plen_54_part_01
MVAAGLAVLPLTMQLQATMLAFLLRLTQVGASEAQPLLHLHACPATTTAAAAAA